MSKRTADGWAALLQSATKDRATRPQGEGWIERNELQKKLGLKNCSFYRFLKQNGTRIEFFNGSDEVNGRLVRRTWYRLSK